MKITVFTPTYNRGYSIHKCYDSLCKQEFKDFEWLIVDDGSNDNTEDIVNTFIDEQKITIRYFKQENMGKHVAINTGVKLAKGELFYIVDSDDYLLDNSLQVINQYWSKVNSDKVIGIGGRIKFVNCENKQFNFKSPYYDQDIITFSLKEGNIVDKSEVFTTKIMKRYPFPSVDGEKFMTEAVVWYRMAQDGYKIRWINEEIYVAEYMEDGLTRNSYKQRKESINSTILAYKSLLGYSIPWKYKVKYLINYLRFIFLKLIKVKGN